MKLYHGSYLEITEPDLEYSRLNVDFGRGFYVTPLYEQAANWCGRFIFEHLIDKKEAIKRLTFEKPNLQYCFRTVAALKFLEFERSETL